MVCGLTTSSIEKRFYQSMSYKYVINHILELANHDNDIKTKPLKPRLFKKLCMDLLYSCSSRWLPRGNVFFRAFELHGEIDTLQEEGHTNSRYLSEPNFLLKVPYLYHKLRRLRKIAVVDKKINQ